MKKYSRPVPLFEVGDLVEASDEHGAVWEVEGYYYEYMYLHGEEHEEMYYNLLCVETSKSKLGVENELNLLCSVHFADSYLRNLKKDNTIIQWADAIKPSEIEEVDKMNRTLKLTKTQKENMANEVLDRYNDAVKFVEQDGEVTDIMKNHINKLKQEWENITGATIID